MATPWGRAGLPRTAADLGITSDQLVQAVLHAPSTRPDRYTILEHLSLDEPVVREKVDEFLALVSG